jgi:putative transposase
MSHAYARNYIHLVFSTRERRPFIRPEWQNMLHDDLRRIAQEYGVALDSVGGSNDHVHILTSLPPKISVAMLVRALKAKSSKMMGDRGHLFGWQAGYGCFSVSASRLQDVRLYIASQEQHHRRRTFPEEFEEILRRHGIEAHGDFA